MINIIMMTRLVSIVWDPSHIVFFLLLGKEKEKKKKKENNL